MTPARQLVSKGRRRRLTKDPSAPSRSRLDKNGSTLLQYEAMLILEGRGAILDVARDVSRVLQDADVSGVVIGGVAVVLHGHVRTTVDVDVLVLDALEPAAAALRSADYRFNRRRREFLKQNVPVHLLTVEQVRLPPAEFVVIDHVRTVGLADLIQMKLDTGLRDPLRAQDLADVIGLIRQNSLTGAFAARIAKHLRPDFRKLARAVQRARGE